MWHSGWSMMLATMMACGPAAVCAQDEAAGQSRWALKLEQGRLSSALHGDALDDPRRFRQTDTDDVRSWARTQQRLNHAPARPDHEGLSWEASVVQEAHVLGAGARAAVRLNQAQASAAGRYPFDLQITRHRRWQASAQFRYALQTALLNNIPVHGLVGVNFLVVDRYKSISAQGWLQDGTDGDLGLQARSTSNELGGTSSFVQPDKPLGWGVTFNLGIEGGQPGQVQWRFVVRDLGPRVGLRHVLGEDKTADTNTLSFDEQGYVNFAPVVRGRYSDREAFLHIEPEWSVGYAQPLGRNGQLKLDGVWHGARQEIGLGYQHQWGSQRLTLTGYALRNMPFSIGLRWDMPHASLAWRGDRLNQGKARVWVVEGGLAF